MTEKNKFRFTIATFLLLLGILIFTVHISYTLVQQREKQQRAHIERMQDIKNRCKSSEMIILGINDEIGTIYECPLPLQYMTKPAKVVKKKVKK